jgi:hypothetical protein
MLSVKEKMQSIYENARVTVVTVDASFGKRSLRMVEELE